MTIQIHIFETSGQAYDSSQCDDSIHDGDLLVVPSERALAILCKAWPVALTEQTAGKAFHTFAGYDVFCRDDSRDGYLGDMVRATSQTFTNKQAAMAYLKTIAPERAPEIRPEWFDGWTTPEYAPYAASVSLARSIRFDAFFGQGVDQ